MVTARDALRKSIRRHQEWQETVKKAGEAAKKAAEEARKLREEQAARQAEEGQSEIPAGE